MAIDLSTVALLICTVLIGYVALRLFAAWHVGAVAAPSAAENRDADAETQLPFLARPWVAAFIIVAALVLVLAIHAPSRSPVDIPVGAPSAGNAPAQFQPAPDTKSFLSAVPAYFLGEQRSSMMAGHWTLATHMWTPQMWIAMVGLITLALASFALEVVRFARQERFSKIAAFVGVCSTAVVIMGFIAH